MYVKVVSRHLVHRFVEIVRPSVLGNSFECSKRDPIVVYLWPSSLIRASSF